MNSGAIKTDDRFIRYGFRGCADILGQLKDGRFLAVECKASGGRLTHEQRDFLDQVNQNGGMGFVARSTDDISANLGGK